MSRFGNDNASVIKTQVQKLVPENTVKFKSSVWKQFCEFCAEKKYSINDCSTAITQLAEILEDWAFNMRKKKRRRL